MIQLSYSPTAPQLNFHHVKPRTPVVPRKDGPVVSYLFATGWNDLGGLIERPTKTGGPLLTPEGYEWNGSSATFLSYGMTNIIRTWTGPFTFLVRSRGVGNNTSGMTLFGFFAGVSDRGTCFGPRSDGTGYFMVATTPSSSNFMSVTGMYSATDFVSAAYRYTPSVEMSIHREGVVDTDTTGVPDSAYIGSSVPMQIGARGDSSTYLQGTIEYLLWWPESLPDERIQILLRDPYRECFKPAVPIFFMPAATGPKTASGALTLAAIQADGAAKRVLPASGAQILPPMTADGTAVRELVASGSLNLGAITLDGLAEKIITASGALVIPAILTDGSAVRIVLSSGALDIPAIQASGAAERSLFGSGALALPQVLVDGSASVGGAWVASGALDLPVLLADGAAKRILGASGTLALPGITISGLAQRILVASGAFDLPSTQADGTAIRELVASGALDLAVISTDGSGVIRKIASGSLDLGALISSGAAQIARSASGALQLPLALVDGTATAPTQFQVASGALDLGVVSVAGLAYFTLWDQEDIGVTGWTDESEDVDIWTPETNDQTNWKH